MWCIQSSPLLIGCNMETIPETSLNLIKNKELIALNQDPLALQARVVRVENGIYLYVKDVETLNGRGRWPSTIPAMPPKPLRSIWLRWISAGL